MTSDLVRLLAGGTERPVSHPLFDSSWYLERHPEVAKAGLDPMAHFVTHGARAGYRPNALFDPAWYLERYPEVREAGLDAFVHFASGGEEAGYFPNPLFDGPWYREQHPELGQHWRSPLAYYLAIGAARDDAPNPLFNPTWYLERYPEVARSGMDPLVHFLEFGADAGFQPNPLFDTTWYFECYPEVAAAGVNPLAHFLEFGARAGYRPNPLFDPAWYLERHPEVAQAGIDPLAHFMDEGAEAGYKPHPLFDTPWYRDRYPAAARKGVNPLVFYLERGAAAGHQPNPLFDPAWYRSQHPEIGGGALDPLLHHLERERDPRSQPNRLFGEYSHFFVTSEPVPSDLKTDTAARGEGPLGAYRELALSVSAHKPQQVPADSGAGYADESEPEVSIIIPVFNQTAHTLACLRSLNAEKFRTRREILVVDDASDEVDYRELLAGQAEIRIIRNRDNAGFVRSCNAASKQARGRYLVFLNNDTLVTDGWLDELLATYHKFSGVGIVGSKLVFPSGLTGEAGGIVWRNGWAWNFGRRQDPSSPELGYARPVDYVSGACLMIEAQLFTSLGGFDEHFCPAYYEDTDLAFRVRRAGYQVLYQPASEVIHFEGVSLGYNASTGAAPHQENHREIFYSRWKEVLETHREYGQNPELEKDRYFEAQALVLDVCTPTPTRDARSLRLLNIMRILRDLRFRVTFVPENLDVPELSRRQLESHGIRVMRPTFITSIEELLAREGNNFDVCLACRSAVAGRWLESLRSHCPRAFVLFDGTDLIPPSALPALLEEGGDSSTQLPATLQAIVEQADATLVSVEPGLGGLEEAHPRPGVHVVPKVFETPEPGTVFEERADVFLVSGFHEAALADALLWIADEVHPLVSQHIPKLRFHVREGEISSSLATGRPQLVPVAERLLVQPRFLDRFRLAAAAVRFGPALAGQIYPVLACGLPCIASDVAAGELPAALAPSVFVAKSAEEFASEIVRLHSDKAAWTSASRSARERIESLFSYHRARRELESLLSQLRSRAASGGD